MKSIQKTSRIKQENNKGPRLAVAMGLSLALNVVLMLLVAQRLVWKPVSQSPPLMVTLINIAPPHHVNQPRKVRTSAVLPKRPVVHPVTPQTRIVREHPARPQAHSRVMVAAPDHRPSPARAAILPGGNAPIGTPIDEQSPGTATSNSAPPSASLAPVLPQAPPQPAPIVTPPPAVVPSTPTPPRAPAGPTQDAAATNQVDPDIPDELKDATFRASVHVKVDVRPDGSFTPTLTSSSGNSEIDRYVLEALRQWKWKPALKEGTPVDSTKYFRFDFEVD